MSILFYFFMILNSIAFLITAYDKRLAVKNKKRISEKTLLSFVVFGGTIGAALAMTIFRHKTSKKTYVLKFMGILFFQVLILFTVYSIKS
ncbi:DUF1294 domain-containing protein [Flavobacterium sp. W22_SRS_FP1]|uniref:DUF1294 domain-containing protein n=1 Tax=Flavobacterium sp. W22_SRS_FP1 TaxID=3240276 RepID=UPI003F931A20